jgi:hypothetical protein
MVDMELKATENMGVVIGKDGDTLEPFILDWQIHGPHLLIGGPSQSGRTSLLHSIALSSAWKYSPDDLWIILMDGANGSLKDLEELPHVIEWVNEEDGLARNIACLQEELDYRRNQSKGGKNQNFPQILFLVDDYDLTCEALALNDVILAKLGKHIRQDSDLNFHFLICSITDNLTGAGDPLIRQMKLARSGVSLVDIDTLEFLGGRPSSAMRKQEHPQGRGYFVSRSGFRLVQIAIPDEQARKNAFSRWENFSIAHWPRPASNERIDQVRSESAPSSGSDTHSYSDKTPGSTIDIEKSLEFYMQQQQQQKKSSRKGG